MRSIELRPAATIRGGRLQWPNHLQVFRSCRESEPRRLRAQRLHRPHGSGYLQVEIE